MDDKMSIAEQSGVIVAAENTSVIGGPGEGFAAVLAENYTAPMVRAGIQDEFSQSGKIIPEENEPGIHFGPTPEDLLGAVKDVIARK